MPDESSTKTSAPQLRRFALAAAVLALGFTVPLWRLVRFAAGNDLHSYILLIPFVSFYLVWLEKKNLPREPASARALAAIFFAAGLAVLAWRFAVKPHFAEDDLALTTLAFVLFLAGLGCVFLGGALMRAVTFPFALLIFLAPFPIFMRDGIEAFLQHGSAVVADGMFQLSGLPVFRDGMYFQLPGMNLEVAPECSGIHSTLVLFITSLVAGRMILHRPWKRAVLVLAVFPLALVRNGFRIFVIGQLCVHIGPQMINSPVHRHGGPLFFVLSLAPFFLLLYFLKKSERPSLSIRPTILPN
jgi:exosortase C (VPDSG-CTERM-specific)